MNRQTILAIALCFLTTANGVANTQRASQLPDIHRPDDKEDVVKITTNLVQVDAVVTKNGKRVTDLTRADFELYDDGKRQTITNFAYVTNDLLSKAAKSTAAEPSGNQPFAPPPILPNVPRRTVALVVDDLGLSFESMASVRNQLRTFISEQLQPNDLIAVIHTGGTVGALQQFTNDRRILDQAVQQLRWNPCNRVGVHVLPPAVTTLPQFATPLCAGSKSVENTLGVIRFVVDAMGELPGRKSMVILSDSLPVDEQDVTLQNRAAFAAAPLGARSNSSLNSDSTESPSQDLQNYSLLLNRIAERAIRSTVVIYAVDAAGLQFSGITAADDIRVKSQSEMNQTLNNLIGTRQQILWKRRQGAGLIASQTGGFLVQNSNAFKLGEIMQDQTAYYLLGYRPPEGTFNKEFHHIKVKVKESGMTVRTRAGFYGFTEEEAQRITRTPAEQASIALMSPFAAHDIDIDFTASFANEKATGQAIRSFIYIDPRGLKFEEDTAGWHNAKVELRGIAFGSNGAIADEVSYRRTLRLRGEAFNDAMRDGLSVQLDLPVKKSGSYQMRVSLRDLSTGRIGAAGQFVTIPDLKNGQLAISGLVLRGLQPGASPEQVPGGATAVRKFVSGTEAVFSFAIYNAVPDPAVGNLPNLFLQIQVFRDGKPVYMTPDVKVNVTNQHDLDRIISDGVISLRFEPGNYYLQATITDKATKSKQNSTSEWINFEIVNPN